MTTLTLLAAALVASAPAFETKAKAWSQATITIHAPVETVWRLVTDVDRWPEWNKAVARAKIQGPVEKGSRFTWTSGGFRIHSRFEEVVPRQRLSWSGRTFGTKARHTWVFGETEGGVVVTTSETFDGWLPTILPGAMQKTLDETLPALLASLKAAAEAEAEVEAENDRR